MAAWLVAWVDGVPLVHGCLVFVTRTGRTLAAHNVRRDFRKVVDRAGLAGRE